MTTLPVLGRRTQSEPSMRTNRMHFIRFRSLREGYKMERRDRRRPVRVDVVSIASSTDIRTRNRRRRRERAKRRIEALVERGKAKKKRKT
uniref:Uncharacterized protein n=1 Tax=Heterorhabditis bacteriophora TaxID=37862 RepID=A0A1I7WIX4_HETBA